MFPFAAFPATAWGRAAAAAAIPAAEAQAAAALTSALAAAVSDTPGSRTANQSAAAKAPVMMKRSML